uniref:Nudix hydrolase domain-containing protein n=1 Tax=Aureoumbra lagunensis TaxID=44058 RepID=A0A7S3NKJ1_9STRA
MRVGVLGAGFSGLRCAQVLERSGLFEAITIIEAQNQAGGRVRTLRRDKGLVLEEGPQWIHGTDSGTTGNPGNPLCSLMDEEDNVEEITKRVVVWADDDYSLVNESLFRSAWCFTSRAITQCEDGHGDYASIGERVRAEAKVEASFLDNDKSREEFLAFCEHRLKYEQSISAGKVDELDLSSWGEYRERAGPNLRIRKGYDRLIQRIVNSLSLATIRFGISALRVEKKENDKIKISLSDDSVLSVDILVVTVSLGALKRGDIIFQPPLPSAKKAAIERLGFGTVNKIAISFDTAWWLDQNCNVWEVVQRKKSNTLSWLQQVVAWRVVSEPGPPTLLAWVTSGEDFETVSDVQLLDTALNALAKISKVSRESLDSYRPKLSLRTRWQTDIAGGSYSFVKVGASGEDFDLLASEDCWPILFAGEHTHRTRYSTADGAYESGERAAAAIIRRTQLPPFACVIVRKDQVLLAEHRASSNHVAPGRLTCFGGKRELGESALDCACREFEEETGYFLEPKALHFSCLLLVNGIQIAHFYTLRDNNHPIFHDVSITSSSSSSSFGALWAAPSDKRWSPWHSAVLDAVFKHDRNVVDFDDGDRAATLKLISRLPTVKDYALLL